jgi:DnaJ-class molecular chaperone
MNTNENTYTSFDFMKIFGIKKGSWNNVKKKYELDQYAEQIVDGKQIKFVYSQKAYEILKENYKKKIVEEIKENPKMFSLVQENETLKATLNEYKQISNKFETMYNEEKKNKEELLEKNAILESTNGSYIRQNHELEGEKYRLELQNEEYEKQIQTLNEEMNKIKNRGFFARLFNK